MPFKDDRQHLLDIIEAIDLIAAFVGELDFDAYRRDLKTKSAVERQILVLTEAAIRLGADSGPRYLGPDWRSWCNMGNVIRHAYHRVSDEIVWNTIKQELPELRQSVDHVLKALQSPPPESA